MTKEKLIDHLEGILEYSRDMAKDSEISDVWYEDIKALRQTIEILRKTEF